MSKPGLSETQSTPNKMRLYGRRVLSWGNMRSMGRLALALIILLATQSTSSKQIILEKVSADSTIYKAEVPLHRYCRNPTGLATQQQHQDVSVGRAGSIPNHPSPFFAARVIKIHFDVDPDVCDLACVNALRHSALVAMGLWRAGCSRCRSDNFNIVVIDDSVWIDSVTLDKWRFALDHRLETPHRDPYAASRVSLRPFGLQPVADFRLFEDVEVKPRICGDSPILKVDGQVLNVACSPLGRRSKCNAPACMQIPIRVGVSRASCRLGPDIIACGTPDSEVGINTDDFVFSYQEGGLDVEFGKGKKKVSLLYAMTHEIGHWFGLPHDNVHKAGDPVNVMSDGYSLNAGWCLTEWNLIQLDNAMDQGWSPRLIENSGLRYPR